MKRISIFWACCLTTFLVISCSEENLESSRWGQTEFKKSFLWEKPQFDTLTRTLEVEFNEDAQKILTDPLVLALYREDVSDPSGAVRVSPQEAEVYVNGHLSSDNTISIDKDSSGEIKIGVVLKELLTSVDKDKDYIFVFKVIQNPGLDRINDLEVTGGKTPVMDKNNDSWTPMNIHVDYVHNKLMDGTISTGVILLAIFIVVVILVRLAHPPFGLKKITLTNDTMQRTIRVIGAGRVVLTSKKQSQSFLKTLFIRRTIYFVDDFFSSGDILVEPKFRITTEYGKRNGVRISTKNYDVEKNPVVTGEDVNIVNLDTNSTINFKI